jgi:hypothetical protein
MKDFFLSIMFRPEPLRIILAREIIKAFNLLSFQDRVAIGALKRPQYAYCIFQAARLAEKLRYPRISIIEFGCGGGNGLVIAEKHIAEVEKLFNVKLDLYGFDLGFGLPMPVDYRDNPHYFKAGLYKMDEVELKRKLKRTQLVIGDIKVTCGNFFDEYSPAPVGCIFCDLDFYSSTFESLKLLDAGPSHFLPRVFMYFDDIIGDDVWLCNDYTGERLAIEEYNKNHSMQKICPDYFLLEAHRIPWFSSMIRIFHDFLHPRYNDYIADDEQIYLENRIRLRSG